MTPMAVLACLLAAVSMGLLCASPGSVPGGRAARPASGPGAGRDAVGGGGTGAGGPGGPRSRVSRLVMTLAAGLGAWFLLGGVPGVLAAVVAGGLAWRTLGSLESPQQRRRREALRRDLPLVVDLLAASLEGGSPPVAAFRAVHGAVDGPVRDELARVIGRLELGADPARVWRELGVHPDLGRLGRSLLRATESGSPVSGALHGLGRELRERARAEAEARARSVAVRAAAPLGLCLLPAFLLLGVVPLVAGVVATFLGN